jgi:hypothetical protein
MYFLRRATPVHLGRERLRGLRISLNAPVIATPELPPGPARAAIVVHRELEGHLAVSVGVRTLKSGEIAVWTADASFTDDAEVAVAIDGALSFAESMGFLFDEEVATGSQDERDRAKRQWEELMGSSSGSLDPKLVAEEEELEIELSPEAELGPEPAPPPAPEPADSFGTAPGDLAAADELELQEEIAAESPEPDVAPQSAGAAPAPPPPEEKTLLSKFRGHAAARNAAAAARTALARVALVRKRVADEGEPSWLQRALVFF